MMGKETKIEWADHSASPWHGCTKVAAGCLNCYAERLSLRNPGTLGVWGDDGVRVKSKSFIKNLRAWNKQGEAQGKPLRVFPSICDPFEDRPELVPWREEMFAVVDECPWIILLLLTKRLENVLRMWPDELADDGRVTQPFRTNVWLGTSIANQDDANRNTPLLLQYRALSPVLFVSAEPLVGPVSFRVGHLECRDCDSGTYDRLPEPCPGRPCGIDWVIIGGESGPHSRECDVRWIRSLRDQCQTAGVPVFVKQLGALVRDAVGLDCEWPSHVKLMNNQCGEVLGIKDPKGGDWSEWPEDLRVRQFPKVEVDQ